MRHLPCVLCFSFFALFFSCKEKTKTSAALGNGSDVKIGQAVKRTLQKQKADTFKLQLDSNTFVSGYADQLSVDVIVEIYDPYNKKLAVFDDPSKGPEYYSFSALAAGMYKVAVVPFEQNTGDYSLIVEKAVPLAVDIDGRMRQILSNTIRDAEVTPGVSIAVTQSGKMVYSGAFGYADIEQEVKATPKTIYHIASVSKQFTAFSIALLADQGKLSLDDDIRNYLPELNDFGPTITINQLVHHTSGLRDQWNLLALAGWRLDDVITRSQVMRLVSRQKELNFKPGDEYVYCNTGFTLLAEIVARVTGEDFPTWTKKNIFDPLEMKNTFFYDDHEKVVKNRAYSYYKGENEFKKSVLSYANVGATSLFTTVEDLSLWALNFEKAKVGSAKVMQLMEQRYVLNNGDTIKYALGQSIDRYKGLKTVSHGGADAGYRTFLLRFPEQQFAVAVFGNFASSNPGGIAYQIADLYLKDQMKEEPKKEIPPPPSEEKPSFDAATVKLANFTGTFYSDELQTAYTFEVVNDTLVAKHQRHDDITFIPSAKDHFEGSQWFISKVDFIRNKAGQVDGLKVSSGRVRNVAFRKISTP